MDCKFEFKRLPETGQLAVKINNLVYAGTPLILGKS